MGSLTFAELTDNRGAASLRKGSKTARTSQKASERLSVKVIYFCFLAGNGKTAQLCAGRSFYVLLIKRLV